MPYPGGLDSRQRNIDVGGFREAPAATSNRATGPAHGLPPDANAPRPLSTAPDRRFEIPPAASPPSPVIDDYVRQPEPAPRVATRQPARDLLLRPQPARLEGTQVVARVGKEVILDSDLILRDRRKDSKVLGSISQFLAMNRDQIPPGQFEKQRQLMQQQMLRSMVENKLILADARRSIPAEAFPSIEEQAGERFDSERLPKLMELHEATSRGQLQEKLRAVGASIDMERRNFIEQGISQSWIQQQLGTGDDVTHDDMLQYYHAHHDDFFHKGRCRWEQLTVRISPQGSRDDAWNKIAHLGNMIIDGAPFADVARQHSGGTTSQQGGQRDWTTQGSLVSHVLDRALFELSVGRLSPILEDDRGLHIVRVIEREQKGWTSFSDAQSKIREEIITQRRRGRLDEYLKRVRRETPVWTIFDDPEADPAVSHVPPAS